MSNHLPQISSQKTHNKWNFSATLMRTSNFNHLAAMLLPKTRLRIAHLRARGKFSRHLQHCNSHKLVMDHRIRLRSSQTISLLIVVAQLSRSCQARSRFYRAQRDKRAIKRSTRFLKKCSNMAKAVANFRASTIRQRKRRMPHYPMVKLRQHRTAWLNRIRRK